MRVSSTVLRNLAQFAPKSKPAGVATDGTLDEDMECHFEGGQWTSHSPDSPKLCKEGRLASFEGLVEPGRIFSAGLGEVGTSAASTADEFGGGFDGIAGMELLAGQFLRDGRDEGDFAFLDEAEQDRDLVFTGAEVVDELLEGFARNALDLAGDDFHAADRLGLAEHALREVGDRGHCVLGEFALRGLQFLLQGGDLL